MEFMMRDGCAGDGREGHGRVGGHLSGGGRAAREPHWLERPWHTEESLVTPQPVEAGSKLSELEDHGFRATLFRSWLLSSLTKMLSDWFFDEGDKLKVLLSDSHRFDFPFTRKICQIIHR